MVRGVRGYVSHSIELGQEYINNQRQQGASFSRVLKGLSLVLIPGIIKRFEDKMPERILINEFA
jgi:DNA polymerase II small subunit/DNA polymerase delta subunit B